MNTVNEQKSSKGKQPDNILWLVYDRNDAPSNWVRVTGLFKSTKGAGYSGEPQPFIMIPPGSRLVVLSPKPEDTAETDQIEI